MQLTKLTHHLDDFFAVRQLDSDPAMSRFMPQVYDAIDFDWRAAFETDFCTRFNGLMISGHSPVSTVFCASFPAPEVIETFLTRAQQGDLLFLHHPIVLECGSPAGSTGRGFLPISPDHLQAIKSRGLSVYTCHAPLDTHEQVGTTIAIADALHAVITAEFLPYGNGFSGRICQVNSQNTATLVRRLKKIFGIPFIDFAGSERGRIEKIAIVAGGGDDAGMMAEAEEMSCQAYITGEIRTRHSGEWGEDNTAIIEQFTLGTKMSIIGVSHAASEYLVMKNQMLPYIQNTFKLKAEAIPQSTWWR